MTRREFAVAAGAATLAFDTKARAQAASAKTLRFIPLSDLQVLDPIWTTAYTTRNHGYMVFDTLFALDSKFKPHPQMVGDYSISPDKLLYSFTLRDGLKFHDGQPVRGVDCVASLNMPERLAKTDPHQQVTEMVGSGPFKFVAEAFEPGHKVVYLKNTDYVPREEPPSWASGGKLVKVDRAEWLYVPDAMTKVAALASGEVDWWEDPPPDMWPVVAANHDITLAERDPLGGLGTLRFNHLLPPFDNVKMRQAIVAVADQVDFMTAYAGDPQNWKLCPSFFACGTPMANNAGAPALTGKRDFDKAKQLIAGAGYKGERIVVLDAVDTPNPHAHALVAADLLKKLGLNVEIAVSDWGNLVIRRPQKNRPPMAAGTSSAPVGSAPICSIRRSIRRCAPTTRRRGSAGRKTTGWRNCGRNGSRRAITRPARRSPRRSSCAPSRPTGAWKTRTAYPKNLKDLLLGPAIFQWNVENT